MATKRRGEDEPRGLPSLAQARAERRRAIVGGKVRVRAMPPQFWLWSALAIAAILVIYWKFAEGALESQKSAVMAKQRAVAQSLGPKILPFRDKIEGWVMSLAKNYAGDFVAQDVSYSKVARSPAVYLRLRREDATSADQIRKAAVRSLRDGFTSCFFIGSRGEDPSQGPPCQSASDCAPGQLCNEYDVCRPPPEPYNMRLAYRSMRVLSTVWTDELHQASNDLKVKVFEQDLEKVTREDVPVSAEILARAKYFVAVIDEDPKGGLPPPADDAGTETEQERVQRVPHPARIGIWELSTGREILRLRHRADARAVPVGEGRPRSQENLDAQARQVLSCDLAMAARRALAPKPAAAADAGLDAASEGADGHGGGADAGAAAVEDRAAGEAGAAGVPP